MINSRVSNDGDWSESTLPCLFPCGVFIPNAEKNQKDNDASY